MFLGIYVRGLVLRDAGYLGLGNFCVCVLPTVQTFVFLRDFLDCRVQGFFVRIFDFLDPWFWI